MDSETNRKLRNAARSCARFSRSASPYCADAKATLCIYRRMGWIGSGGSFQKSNVKKIGVDMFNVPAFKRVAGGSTKQGRQPNQTNQWMSFLILKKYFAFYFPGRRLRQSGPATVEASREAVLPIM